MKYLHHIFFALLTVSCIESSQAQDYHITRDTNYMDITKSSSVRVVHTYLTHYYYVDTTCVKIIGYPQISGIKNKQVENDLNITFSKRFVMGDCIEKEPEGMPLRTPPQAMHISLLKVINIKNDLLSYMEAEGDCKAWTPLCLDAPKAFLIDLKTGKESRINESFYKNQTMRNELEWMLFMQMDTLPTFPDRLIDDAEIYFDNQKLYFLYPKGVVENSKLLILHLPLEAVRPYIKPQSAFARLFKNKQENIIFRKKNTM